MKTKYISLVCFGASGLFAACAHNPPQSLVDARQEYERVKAGETAQVAPAQLHEAAVALDRANQSFIDDGDSQKTRDLAYVADRKTLWAESEALTVMDNQQRTAAEKDQLSTAVATGKSARHELHQTQEQIALQQQQLAQSSQQLQSSNQQLDQEKQARVAAEQNAAATQAKLEALAQVKDDERGKIITLNGSVLFVSGQAELLDGARNRLSQVAEALKTMGDKAITVEGYTDSRGSEDLNQRLSERRAQVVRDYLAGQGLDPSRIKSMGLGKAKPIADNKTADGRAMNRRVEIIVEKDKS